MPVSKSTDPGKKSSGSTSDLRHNTLCLSRRTPELSRKTNAIRSKRFFTNSAISLLLFFVGGGCPHLLVALLPGKPFIPAIIFPQDLEIPIDLDHGDADRR